MSADTLPPLPELPARRIRHVYNESKGYECDCWTAEMVRAYAIEYAAAAVQAEREACEAIAHEQRERSEAAELKTRSATWADKYRSAAIAAGWIEAAIRARKDTR